ncbi:MAG: GrdX family protein [bacterium]|jgi:hypothetical protein
MSFTLLSNNFQLQKKYPDLEIKYIEGSVLHLFTYARDLVHQGYRLITHPLSGSLKPGSIPYKTIFISRERGELDLKSLHYIENSIEAYYKTRPEIMPQWSEEMLADYAAVDLAQVEAALASLQSGAVY